MEGQRKGEKRSADEGGKHGDDVVLWIKGMEAKLDSKSKHCQPSQPFTIICRVPRDIRRVSNQAYNPVIVSIGPYHRGNSSLRDMEEVKWRNLNEFRGRAGNKFNEYLTAMKEIEPRARACYAGKIDLKEDDFIEMMLLDGLFIIELLWTKGNSFPALLGIFNITKKEPIHNIRGLLCRVLHDMLLLENQLSFFVLERLWKLTGQRMRIPLWERACYFIQRFAMQFEHEWGDFKLHGEIFAERKKKKKKKKNREKINAASVDHLLHLAYLLLKPTEPTTTGSSSESMKPTAKLTAFIKKMMTLSFQPPRCRDCFPSPSACQKSQFMECTKKLPAVVMKKMITLSFPPPGCHSSPSPSGEESQSMECTAKLPALIKKILPSLSPSKSKDEQPRPLKVIPSAVELDEAGVVFKCVKAERFLDVKFKQGTMKMPRLSLGDSTKSLLRNFIAYEHCFPYQGNHITIYCSFMDQLVNTPRDVEILKKSKIIENRVGSDEEAALFFNDLCKGIFLSDDSRNYLAIPSKDVRKYTKKVWPKWRAKLLRDYFGSPWSIVSFLAATFVVIFTGVQTYYAVFT